MDRNVYKYRCTLDGETPDWVSAPSQEDTSAALIEATGMLPHRGSPCKRQSASSASRVRRLTDWRDCSHAGATDDSLTRPRRGSTHSPRRSRRLWSCSQATASDRRVNTLEATSRPWDFTRALYRTAPEAVVRRWILIATSFPARAERRSTHRRRRWLPAGVYHEVMAFERITVDPTRMGGVPCIRDLRVTVSLVLGQLAAGVTVDQLLPDYPYVERADDTAT